MAQEHGGPPTGRVRVVSIYVDRTNRHWVVRDGDGRLWELPATDNPWVDRRPYETGGDADLEPVPGHYRDLLGLPH
jgi:hypothetical protein